MELPKLGQLLVKLDKLLDRYVDSGPGAADIAQYRAFLWDGTRKALKPLARPARVDLRDLIGIDAIQQAVVRNTKRFIDGNKANNVLLWGERGTGKSSLVKSLLTEFAGTDLRMVQICKHDILTIQDLFGLLAGSSPCRFILFIDDLSF